MPHSGTPLEISRRRAELRAMNPDKARARCREWRNKNLEKARAGVRKWQSLNPGKIRAAGRAWREKNREKSRAYGRAWRAKNIEKIKASNREWALNNPEKSRASTEAWRLHNRPRVRDLGRAREAYRCLNDPAFKLKKRLRKRINEALRGAVKSRAAVELVGCSWPDLRAYLEKQFRPGMSWKNYGPEWHVDHIHPCCKFDLTIPEQQKRCFHFSNLQPLFKLENLRKGGRFVQD